ncbi:hypothetical protein WN943_025161 [Citrus x changshan-huyou]
MALASTVKRINLASQGIGISAQGLESGEDSENSISHNSCADGMILVVTRWSYLQHLQRFQPETLEHNNFNVLMS